MEFKRWNDLTSEEQKEIRSKWPDEKWILSILQKFAWSYTDENWTFKNLRKINKKREDNMIKNSSEPPKTNHEHQTLRDDIYVASRIEFSRRRENLSFQHHKEVASLEPEDQDYWLDKAEEENLSVHELRKRIREWKRKQLD